MRDLKHTGRRAFLQLLGGGALALPLLEYTHGKAWSQGVARKIFGTVMSHGGTIIDHSSGSALHDGTDNYLDANYWKPADPGENLVLGPIMQPLVGHESKLLVLQGVDNRAAMAQAQYGSGGHGTSNVTCLTAADIANPGDDAIAQGPSIDHVLAERLNDVQPVKFKRIHLRISGHQYGSPYFSGAGQRVNGEDSPVAAFNTIFEGITGDEEPDPAWVHQQTVRRNVLDGVLDGYNRFKGTVSQRDLHTIEAHIDHINDLRAQLEAAPVLCQPPSSISDDDGAPGNIVGPLHVQIMLAALRCGLTNVANLEISDIITPWAPSGTLIDSAFNIGHSLGHYARELGPTGESTHLAQDWLTEMTENRQWRMGLVKQLLDGLDDPAFAEGGSTMLDNSLFLYTSEFSEPAKHVSRGQLTLMAGSAGGYFRSGRNINYNIHAQSDPNTRQYDSNESIHNLFASILQAFGGSDDSFGGDHAAHSGPLPNLT